jgi:hypothetical protein
LTGISLKAEKTIERTSILAGQLEKVFLSLIIIKEEKIVMVSKLDIPYVA